MSKHAVDKKAIYKNGWFWLIIIIIGIILIVMINEIVENKEREKSMQRIAETMKDFMEETDNAKSHIDEFSYNYETGEVEYHPEITLESYDKIKEEIKKKNVINILGSGEKIQSEESSGYLMTWGNLETWEFPYYCIQITFDSTNKVISKNQIGLK